MLLGFFLNPFLALFLLAAIAVYYRVPTAFFFVAMPISFALFFYFREYGVDWSITSSDDVPNYIDLYQQDALIGFFGIIPRYLENPGTGETLWHMLWWPLVNIFDASDETFVFLHYALIFFGVFLSLYVLSRRYFIALAVVYFFATPLSIESITYLWRQQLAFSMLLTGIGLYFVHGRRWGRWLIYVTPLMHVAMLFFLAVFVVFELYRKYVGLKNARNFVLIAIFNLFAVTILSKPAIAYLDSLGLDRVQSYLEGSGQDQTSVFVSVLLYSIPLFLAQLRLKNDDVNSLFAVVFFSVLGMMVAFPGATGIYIRFLMFVFPLYGLYFFRACLMNFSTRWVLPILFIVFFSGAIRMYRPTLNDEGVVRFLAFGHAFDPFMGVLKMLLSFGTS